MLFWDGRVQLVDPRMSTALLVHAEEETYVSMLDNLSGH